MTLAPSRPPAAAWPGLDVVPSGARAAVSARIARRLFDAAVSRLDVTVVIADPDRRRTLGRGGPVMTVHRPDEFFARIGRHQLIGFGEAYLTGAWDAEDLSGFLAVLAAQMPDLVPRNLQRLRAMVVARPPRMHRNSQRNTRDNIAHHYDLSNDLFGLFLDPSLNYSSALFESEILSAGDHRQAAVPREGSDLHAAQLRKIDRLLDETRVCEGTRVLEIGTGWGELAIRAAHRGATVRTVTLSTEQKALAEQRIAAAGVADRVDVELCDYRQLRPEDGRYDAVVSVEMIEAVGHQYWSTYFSTIDRLLAPGGRVGIQAITMPHDRMLATRRTYTWINKYIFPGGFLPSVEAVEQVTSRDTTLRVANRLSMGLHYAETLRQWDEAFLAASRKVRALGFDETFERMWHFYLEYSRAGFTSGYLDVQQLTLMRREERA
ncbi:cyclopropane-fatty-acyl-phospholipid synthase family protein [Nocardioides sp.]|uniref:cyclopropane-fatty-acyl-phospholipid synthase family protein n=1 Tax=Nocardioides sp. TaxID=35761 RepID=UPI002D7EC234|nr:cyclopropane-fatty-acyl-phospholipid synthase family protein [Nocardioides sp.]HET8961725.1 cyclopropane-fatty-acyl-phospholipid synthase family protein [Nocardioides sp.]